MKRKVFTYNDINFSRDQLLLAPELCEADEIAKTDPERAEHIRATYWNKIREEDDLRRRDERDRKNKAGKYDPINIILGSCRICGGDVVQRMKEESDPASYGTTGQTYRVHDCYFCKGCDIVYANVPKWPAQ